MRAASLRAQPMPSTPGLQAGGAGNAARSPLPNRRRACTETGLRPGAFSSFRLTTCTWKINQPEPPDCGDSSPFAASSEIIIQNKQTNKKKLPYGGAGTRRPAGSPSRRRPGPPFFPASSRETPCGAHGQHPAMPLLWSRGTWHQAHGRPGPCCSPAVGPAPGGGSVLQDLCYYVVDADTCIYCCSALPAVTLLRLTGSLPLSFPSRQPPRQGHLSLLHSCWEGGHWEMQPWQAKD